MESCGLDVDDKHDSCAEDEPLQSIEDERKTEQLVVVAASEGAFLLG